jgi:hypothetical protein
MAHQPNNIFAGTQVVSLVEVRGTNDSLVQENQLVSASMARYGSSGAMPQRKF